MKKKEKDFRALEDKDSSLYCGSACIYSLFPLVRSLEKSNKEFAEAFPEFESLLERMVEEDGFMFALSMKKEEYTTEDWTKLIASLQDNEKLIQYVDNLYDWCEVGFISKYRNKLKEDSLFLKGLLQNSLKIFYDIENPPMKFLQVAASCMQTIRGALDL
jgi:hypothetical protein